MDATKTVEEVSEVPQVVEEVYFADPAKHAFVTWVIMGDEYVTGALILAQSIKNAGSKASLVILVSSDVSKEARTLLASVFDQIVEVPVIDVKVPQKKKNDKNYDSKIPLYSKAFTKIHALNLTKFEKVALLDADQLCVANPDSIFKVDGPAGICTSLLRPADAAAHGEAVPQKAFESCYKEGGIRGCTYLLVPSEAEYKRALDIITTKAKVIQYQVTKQDTMSMLVGKKSKFALLDEDEDNNDEEAQDESGPRMVVRTLTAEEVAASRFDDETPEPEVTYPYEVLKLDTAPLGFSFGENKRSMMGYDEIFFADMYKNQWKHLHNKYGHTSWKKNEAAPVFLHFTTAAPWKRDQDWTDYESWDAVALELMKKSTGAHEFLGKAVPILLIKEANGSAASINPPASKKSKKDAKKEAAAAIAGPETVATKTWGSGAVKPVEETEAVAPVAKPIVAVPAPIPAKKAWGSVAAKTPSSNDAQFPALGKK